MKFFLSQMEISKEAVRVGTLALIRAVVSADGDTALLKYLIPNIPLHIQTQGSDTEKPLINTYIKRGLS